MKIEINLKNYRCFPDSHPACFTLGGGFLSLIGANNSGKSALMRILYVLRPIFHELVNGTAIQHSINRIVPPPSKASLESSLSRLNPREMTVEFSFDGEGTQQGKPIARHLRLTLPRALDRYQLTIAAADRQFHEPADKSGQPIFELALCREGLRLLHRSNYFASFRGIVGNAQRDYDLSLGQQFVQEWRSFKTGGNHDARERAYKVTDAIARLLRVKQFDINPSDDGKSIQLMIDGRSFDITEVGSGLSQVILILAHTARACPSFVLIDEPELNLHPSLQLEFLTALGSFAENGVMFSTHSIGLARAAADHILSLYRISEGISEIRQFEATRNLSEFLGELSFSGQRELGFEKILLVEGPSEVRAIQQFLRQLRKEHTFILLPLGGASLINEHSEHQLNEVKRISTECFAVIDSEKSSAEHPISRSREAFRANCEKAEIRCCVLERRATENYLTDAAVKKVKGPKYRALGPYEFLSEATPSWGKDENWKIAAQMEFSDIAQTDLGHFLTNITS
jgi:ABC-type cobalamin/Fe3+-siderophores transport system ATPase subunit